jgi:hypothetical protein
VFRFARSQEHSSEALQFFHRARNAGVRVAYIKLRHFRTLDSSRVPDVKGNPDGLIEIAGRRRERQIAAGKGCEGQPEAEPVAFFSDG